jgi:hypothetical protein
MIYFIVKRCDSVKNVIKREDSWREKEEWIETVLNAVKKNDREKRDREVKEVKRKRNWSRCWMELTYEIRHWHLSFIIEYRLVIILYCINSFM